MRKFVIKNFSKMRIPSVIECRGTQCAVCKLRFACFTQDSDFVIEHGKGIFGYKFNDNYLPDLEGIRQDGCRLGLRVETIVEYLIAGENVPVPMGQWSQGWVI